MSDSKSPTYRSPAPSYTPLHQSGPVDEYSQKYPLQQSYRAQHLTMSSAIHETRGGDWQSSLCGCSPCGSCILGTFAPCLLVGRTASRLQDPTSDSPDMCNGDCMIHGGLTVLFGSGWIYSMIKRGDIRQRFGIPGSGCGDCCAAFWCQCCQVIQADNEVKARLAPMVDKSGYVPQAEGMVPYPQ